MTGLDFWIWFVVFVAAVLWFVRWMGRQLPDRDVVGEVSRSRRFLDELGEACGQP